MATQRAKTIVITGASAGIGACVAERLSAQGAHVVVVGRSKDKTAAVASRIGATPRLADYARLSDVRRLASDLIANYPVIDVVVHNAGGMSPDHTVTEDGHELTLQTNYLAPFLLQHLLSDRLAESNGHVVVTASVAHRFAKLDLNDLENSAERLSGGKAYPAAKLADVLFAREIARRTPTTGITAVAFHPGLVGSSFGRQARGMQHLIYNTPLGKPFRISNDEGATPLITLANHPDPASINGQYFDRTKGAAKTSRQASDAEFGRQLWARTESILKTTSTI